MDKLRYKLASERTDEKVGVRAGEWMHGWVSQQAGSLADRGWVSQAVPCGWVGVELNGWWGGGSTLRAISEMSRVVQPSVSAKVIASVSLPNR